MKKLRRENEDENNERADSAKNEDENPHMHRGTTAHTLVSPALVSEAPGTIPRRSSVGAGAPTNERIAGQKAQEAARVKQKAEYDAKVLETRARAEQDVARVRAEEKARAERINKD